MIEFIKEECPKAPVFMFPIFDRNQDEEIFKKIQILNELFTFSSFKNLDILLPIDFQTSFLNCSCLFERRKKNYGIFEQASHLAPLISNTTAPFRIKEDEGIASFINKILFFPTLNIFNLVGTIPIVYDKKFCENNIFQFKKNKGDFFYLNAFGNESIGKSSVIFFI